MRIRVHNKSNKYECHILQNKMHTCSLLSSLPPNQKFTASHIHIHSILSCTVQEATKLYSLTQFGFLIVATAMINTTVIRKHKLIYLSNKKYIPKNEDIFYLHISWE
jgi:hypothetical protein